MNNDMAPSNNLEMARPAPYTYNEYCRICANKSDNMMSIFVDEGVDHMMETKIKTHLPFLNVMYSIMLNVKSVIITYSYISLQICADDVLPKKICYSCASAVLVWDELYDASSMADNKLRNWFGISSYDQGECKVKNLINFKFIGYSAHVMTGRQTIKRPFCA